MRALDDRHRAVDAGVHTVALYFTGPDPIELEIRELGDALYGGIDWAWAATDDGTLRHGWLPETGFLEARWDRGYSEAMLLYILALGSPTSAIASDGYLAWTRTFERLSLYGFDQLH
ncbi:MAG: glucoamylase family protein, partial [Kofleriaceae bacterium]